jgi:ABC-type transport system involved in cytochrome bd biosynthesis fused ATPase/permease subunit
MLGLFVTLGIAILTLLVILLWFVPHLLQQQAQRAANDTAQLRQMLADMVGEQEMTTLRQGQLGSTIAYLQQQVEQMDSQRAQARTSHQMNQPFADPVALRELEHRILTMQTQVETHLQIYRLRAERENESWANLYSLLSAMLERLHDLSSESHNPKTKHTYTQEL